MTSKKVMRIAAVLIAVGIIAVAANACPPDSIAGTGDLMMTPFGPVVVESCVTESGGTTTFHYEITNEGRSPIDLCALLVPGLGSHVTTGSSAPLGFTMDETSASGCAAWWEWMGGPAEIHPGETVTFSMSLNTPATPARRRVFLTFCDGTKDSVEALVPSACPDIADDPLAGCLCGEGDAPCESTGPHEGDGTRINLLGLDRQVLAVCGASYVRHGFVYLDEVDPYDFTLEIDGVRQVLDQRIYCLPGDRPGAGYLGSSWFIQFPPEYFEAGRLYEFTGTWFDYEAPPGERVILSRTIELQVIPCLVPVILEPFVPELPDLVCEIVDVVCECAWTPDQRFECEIVATVVATNIGGGRSDLTALRLTADGGVSVRSIPELAPGESHAVLVRLKTDVDPTAKGPCHPEIEVEIDFSDFVEEVDEANNIDAACCQ